MRNFVILFRQREGSSPIIDLLSRHPNIKVPIFEHLDFRVTTREPNELYALLDALYAWGDFDTGVRILRSGGEAADPPPLPLPPDSCVGFKWRIWGDPDTVSEILLKHDVMVFHLFRSNLMELAVSVYFTTHIVPTLLPDTPLGAHPQFAFAEMNAEDQAAVSSSLSKARFEVDVPNVLHIMRETLNAKRYVTETYVRAIGDRGVAVRSLLYEDFIARRDEFVRQLCGRLELPSEPLAEAEPWYKRILPNSILEQVVNLDGLLASVELQQILGNYQGLIRQGHSGLLR